MCDFLGYFVLPEYLIILNILRRLSMVSYYIRMTSEPFAVTYKTPRSGFY